MRSRFPEHYLPGGAELDALWDRGIIVLDANVLLNVYRIQDATRGELLRILERHRERVWVPYQFALEYQRRRLRVIAEQAEKYRAAAEHTGKLIVDFESDRAPFVTPESLDGLRDVRIELEAQRDRAFALLSDDPHHSTLSSLLEGRIGDPPDATSRTDLLAQARRRFDEGVPPGFRDAWKGKREQHREKAGGLAEETGLASDPDGTKAPSRSEGAVPKGDAGRHAAPRDADEANRYGDCLGWLQVLAYAKARRSPCLFVSDDRKEDWWQFESGRRIGPLPALIREFRDACGEQFHMYLPSRFLQWASDRSRMPVLSTTIEELQQLEQRGGAKATTDVNDGPEGKSEDRHPLSDERVRKGD